MSALYDSSSLSAGKYHYSSDGWRDNNDVEEDIYNIFAQWAISPVLNVQAEFRHRKTDEGDLAFNFDPDDYLANKTLNAERVVPESVCAIRRLLLGRCYSTDLQLV